MDKNEFKLRQLILGEGGAITKFHQQITEARNLNVSYVYIIVNRQKVKISKPEISKWLRATPYFKHLSHLRSDNQFLEAVYSDPNLKNLAQRSGRVLSPYFVNTIVAMTHLNDPDQEEALKSLVDNEEKAEGRLDYVPENIPEKLNQAIQTQKEHEERESGGKAKNQKEESHTSSGGAPKSQPQQTPEPEQIHLDRSQPNITTLSPAITESPIPRQPFLKRVSSNLSPKNTPSFLKDLGSKAQILTSRLLKNPMVVSTFVGGLAGGALGLGITGTTQGALIGGLAGGALPTAAKTGALRGLLGLGGRGVAGLAGRAALGAAGGPLGLALAAASLAPNVKSWTQKYLKWVIAAVVGFLFLFFVLIPMDLLKTNSLFPPFEQNISTSTPTTQQNRVAISKRGTTVTTNRGNIEYQIEVTYQGRGKAYITINDKLPDTIEFLSANEQGTHQKDDPNKIGGGTVTWKIDELAVGSKKQLTISARALAEADNTWLINQAEATIASISGTLSFYTTLLPNPLPEEPSTWQAFKENIVSAVYANPSNIEIYQQAQEITGVPWEVLAGIHFIEGNSDPNKSLTSGRPIGAFEPDVPIRSCQNSSNELGKPIQVGGGCGFRSLLDTAVYAGNHLKGKIGDQLPENFQQAVKALSRYNGGGNSNCGKTPYIGCPKEFEGEDDIYPMSKFSKKHEIMYLVYCADLTRCNPPQQYARYGVMTVVRALKEAE